MIYNEGGFHIKINDGIPTGEILTVHNLFERIKMWSQGKWKSKLRMEKKTSKVSDGNLEYINYIYVFFYNFKEWRRMQHVSLMTFCSTKIPTVLFGILIPCITV